MRMPCTKYQNVCINFICYFLLLAFWSCSKPDENKPQNAAPTVTTASVSIINSTSATLGGSITNDGGSSISDRGVCYGVMPNPTIAINKVQIGTGTGSFDTNVMGLQPNTRYYVRAYASNTAGLSYGNEQNFTTTAAPVDSAVSLYIGGKDSLFAFNAQTGALKWKRYIGPEFIISSPAYSNGKIFVAYKTKLFAFDTLGNALWTATTNSDNVNGYQSPVVGNGLVYTCNEGSRFIYAFNQSTGSSVWTFDAREAGNTLFGVADLAIAGNTIYIASQNTYAIDAITGVLRWKTTGGSMVLPLISNGKVYVMSFYTLTTLDSAAGTILRSKVNNVLFSRPMSLNLSNGRFFYTDENWTAAFDTSINANVIWQNNSVSPSWNFEEAITHSPIIIDNKAYCRSAAGSAVGLDTQTGNILWQTATEGRSITIVNGICYTSIKITTGAVDRFYIKAVDIATNTQKWISNNNTSNFLSSSPCVVTKSGKMYRFGMTFN